MPGRIIKVNGGYRWFSLDEADIIEALSSLVRRNRDIFGYCVRSAAEIVGISKEQREKTATEQLLLQPNVREIARALFDKAGISCYTVLRETLDLRVHQLKEEANRDGS